MLLPITFPRTIAGWLIIDALIATMSSGRLVDNDIKINPTTNSLRRRKEQICERAFTRRLPAAMSKIQELTNTIIFSTNIEVLKRDTFL